MTWANFIATGIGGDGIEYRLVIEGCEIEPCTSLEMAGNCTETGQDGKRRVPGLMREGLGFSEACYLAGAELSVGINAIRVMETPYPDLDAATSVFASAATTATFLAATITASATSAQFRGHGVAAVDDYLHIGTETVKVTAAVETTDTVDGETINVTNVTIVRGKWRTTGQRHTVSTSFGIPAVRPLRDGVRVWKGRRVWLYAHGPSELAVGDTGTLVWRGLLASKPQLDGGDAIVWTLAVDSRWTLLDQEIGAGLDKPQQLRGAYYPGEHCFAMHLSQSPGGATWTGLGATIVRIQIVGFYETNETFLAALVAALNADSTLTTSWGYSFTGRIIQDRWEVLVTQPVTPIFLDVRGGSPVDGWFKPFEAVPEGDPAEDVINGLVPGVRTVTANSTYILAWDDTNAYRHGGPLAPHRIADPPPPGARQMPRTLGIAGAEQSTTLSDFTDHPLTRCYVADVTSVAAGDAVVVITQDAEGADVEPVGAISFVVGSFDAATGKIDAGSGTLETQIVSAGNTGNRIEIVKRVGGITGIDLAGFRDALIAAAPDGANDATTPWVLSDDIASWTTVVTEAAMARSALTDRAYLYKSGVRVSDVIKHECRLLGVYPCLDADFKVTLRHLTLDTAATVYHLRDDDGSLLTDRGFGDFKSGEDGNVNVVEFSTGYDYREDKHVGSLISVLSVEGMSELKARNVLDVKPKSGVVGSGGDITRDDAQRVAGPVLALFGGQIDHYTFDVPGTFFGVLVGDTILVTSPHLPYAGKRTVHDPGEGLVARRLLVVGREWDLERGTGRLTGLSTGLNVAGYTPTGRVASAAGATTSWTLTLTANHYSPTGDVDASYFVAGDTIKLIEWDAATPTVRVGTVDSVSGNDVAVTIDSWAGLGGATYNLISDDSDTPVTSTQAEGAYIAAADMRIDDGSTGRSVQIIAP